MWTRLVNWIIQATCMHEWTCKAEQGIPPNDWESNHGVQGFKVYATMYCKRCGKVSSRNLKY